MVNIAIVKEAFEVFEDIRSAISMYMFIIEEAIQTLNMANWVLYKANLLDKVKENIDYIRNDLAQPLKNFAESPAGYVAYPMNISYIAFAESTLKALDSLEQAIKELSKSTE
ncbi:hypothetical protein DRJ16_07840 [Candidatus Woesearchaeota archaeon]|nr:MAG: hypothetical protein DRJ16_07840 [Candidatus Woesearchaeota archaeon]